MPFKQIKSAYNHGELSEYMAAREDTVSYHNGASKIINATVLPHGGFVKRPGTIYKATAPNRANLVPFEFSVDDALILEFSNLLIRFYKDGNILSVPAGVEDYSALDNLVAHWKLNDNLATQVVLDDTANDYDGTTVTNNTSVLHATGNVGTGCLDLFGTDAVELDADSANHSFDDSGSNPFSIVSDIYVTEAGIEQVILSKWQSSTNREWKLSLDFDNKLKMSLYDDSTGLDASRVAHWKLNDNAASTAVDDAVSVVPHDGTASANTNTIHASGKVGSGSFDFDGSKSVEVTDHAALSFDDTSDENMSISAWIYVTSTGSVQGILSKWDIDSKREWLFYLNVENKLRLHLSDQSTSKFPYRESDNAISSGWHFVCAVYDNADASWTGATATNFITLYLDEAVLASTANNEVGYVGMENLGANVAIGASLSSTTPDTIYADKIDNVVLFNKALTVADVTTLYNNGDGTEEMEGEFPFRLSDSALSIGWHTVVGTYDSTGGVAAASGIILYVDGVAVASTATNVSSYVAMENTAIVVRIGAQDDSSSNIESVWQDRIDNVVLFSDVLTPTEVGTVSSSAAYSIVSSYTSTQAFQVHTTQSADVMYIAHEDHHPKKLSRLRDREWTITNVPFTGGPFLDENITAASLVGFARTGGTARNEYYFPAGATGTLTASGTGNALFNSNMVGALWLVKHTRDNDNDTDTFAKDTNVVPTLTTFASGAIFIKGDATVSFEPIATGKMAQLWRKEGNGNWQTYRSFRGAVAFSWTEDEDDVLYAMTRSDNTINGTLTAKNQVNRGVVKIIGFTSAMVVTVEVIDKVLSNNSNDNAITTPLWAEGAWSDYRGYPRTVTFFEDRLWWASSANNPDTLWSSKTGKYENMEFSSLGLDDDAIVAPINDNEVSQIQWMQARQVMAIGAANKEYRFGASNIDDPTTPSDRKATPQTGFGSGDIQPVILNDTIFFFQRAGKKLGAMKFDSITENFAVDDATLLAYKLFDSAPTNMAVQRVPDSLIWTVRTDGILPTFTYEPKEEVSGWARQIFGNSAAVETATGFVESVAIIHGSSEDEVWVCIRRVINTNTVYYVEKFAVRDWGSDIEDAFFVDSGVTYDSTPTTTITGLTHLIGETVAVFADGLVQDKKVVNGSGEITITSASTVQVGLPYTMKVRTMRLSVPQSPTIQTRIKRIHSTVVRYIRSLLGSAGQEYGGVEYLQPIEGTYSTESQDTPQDNRLTKGGFTEDAYTIVVSDDPVPFTCLATIVSAEVEERR